MKPVWIIAKATILENSRKHVFHVLCLLILAVLVGSTLLSIFTEGVKIKMLKDLCMTGILFGGAVLAIALGSSGIPGDVESRTIYPIIARPVTRMQYVAGKYLGTLLTVVYGLAAMGAIFGVLIFAFEGGPDWSLALVMLFAILEVAVVAAVATTMSVFATPATASVLTFMVFVAGSIKIGYFGEMLSKMQGGAAKLTMGVFYHLVPNLECFNIKSVLVHQEVVPVAYLIQVLAYGVICSALVLLIGATRFSAKEV